MLIDTGETRLTYSELSRKKSVINSSIVTGSLMQQQQQQQPPPSVPTLKMERPKSAKHNIERLRKSAYLNKLNMINNRHFNNSTNSNRPPQQQHNENLISSITPSPTHHHNHHNFDEKTNHIQDLDDDDEEYNHIMAIRRKEQRLLATKSAYISGLSIAKQRPQSARHNLDKYRNDVLVEKQKKLELIQQIYKTNNNNTNITNITENNDFNTPMNVQDNLSNQENISNPNQIFESMFDNEDIDNLDGLFIREEEDSNSESDYTDSKATFNNNKNNLKSNTNHSKLKTHSQQQKSKLLAKRIANTKENNNNNNDNNINPTNTNSKSSDNQNLNLIAATHGQDVNPNQMRIYRENTFNHLNKSVLVPALNNNNTIESTSMSIVYATNPLTQHTANSIINNNNNNNEINSILFHQRQQQQLEKQQLKPMRPPSGSTVNSVNIAKSAQIKMSPVTQQKQDQHLQKGIMNMIDSVATNSSSSSTCSSTSSSVTATSSKVNQPQIIHLNELSSNNDHLHQIVIDQHNPNKKTKPKNSQLSQELLNEWYKDDEEIDNRIEAGDMNGGGSLMPDFDSIDYIEFDNTPAAKAANGNTKSQLLQQRNVKSNLQKQSILLALNAGRNSRFSDYSACSNKTSLSNPNNKLATNKTNNINNTSNNNNNNNFLSRERTNGSMDPWTKRNPTLVAQNVLIKHRAELEQLAARHNSNSRASNHSSLLATSNSKFLLPDSKYFKKNNF